MENQEAVEATEESVATEGSQNIDRPEWLPEKFTKAEDLASAYSSLESKLGQKEDDFRKSFMEEIEREAYANRPADKGDYILPESIDESVAPDNPLLNWWADHAFENGMSQDEFSEGINVYMEALAADAPDFDAEVGKLGDNANARIESVSLFANQFFPQDHMSAVERMCETAEGVQALEFIMENMQQQSPNSSSQAVAQVSESDLQQMMLDDRYHNPAKRDAGFIKQVEEGFRKIYGS